MKQPSFFQQLRAKMTAQRPAKLEATTTSKPRKLRVSMARVQATSRDYAHELSVLWWRWRHNFLEAKRIEMLGDNDATGH